MQSLILALISLLPLLTSAAPPRHKRNTDPIYDGSTINGKTYDYVIAGGGLAGSVVGARLSQGGTRSVLIIEAGYNEEGRPGVYGMCERFLKLFQL